MILNEDFGVGARIIHLAEYKVQWCPHFLWIRRIVNCGQNRTTTNFCRKTSIYVAEHSFHYVQ
jgi:hypothetical protein